VGVLEECERGEKRFPTLANLGLLKCCLSGANKKTTNFSKRGKSKHSEFKLIFELASIHVSSEHPFPLKINTNQSLNHTWFPKLRSLNVSHVVVRLGRLMNFLLNVSQTYYGRFVPELLSYFSCKVRLL
jgi:hypothetical protein